MPTLDKKAAAAATILSSGRSGDPVNIKDVDSTRVNLTAAERHKELMTVLKKGFGIEESAYLKDKKEAPTSGSSFLDSFIEGMVPKGLASSLKNAIGTVTGAIGTVAKIATRVTVVVSLINAVFDFFKGFDEEEAKKLTGGTSFINKLESAVLHLLSGLTLGLVSPEALKRFTTWVNDRLQPIFDPLFGVIDTVVGFVAPTFQLMKDKFDVLATAANTYVIDPLSRAFKAIGEGFSTLMKGLEGVPLIGPKIKEVMDSLGAGVKAAGDTGRALGKVAVDTAQAMIGAGGVGERVDILASGVKGALGVISERFESGGKGTAAVSSGKGDFGGASYGKYQLSSKTGTLDEFLKSSGYAEQFGGMTAGTEGFNKKWKELAGSKEFQAAEHEFIKKTHYDAAMAGLGARGIDFSGKGRAVQEAVWSTAVQYGPEGAASLFEKALRGRDVGGMSDAEIVSAVQDYKAGTVSAQFKSSSPAVQANVLKRIGQEKRELVQVASAKAMADVQVPPAPAAPDAAASGSEATGGASAGDGSSTRVALASIQMLPTDSQLMSVVMGIT